MSSEIILKDALKNLITQVTEPQQMVFKRMYSNENLDKDIVSVIDDMLPAQLNWAITQVEKTIKKYNQADGL